MMIGFMYKSKKPKMIIILRPNGREYDIFENIVPN